MADIVVDTYKLTQYAQRISDVNRRINRLDYRLNTLYTKVGLLGLWNLMQADALTGYSWRLLRCQTYLQQTAADFERNEKKLSREDPLSFDKSPSVEVKKVFFNVGVAIKKGAEKVKKKFEKAVENIATSYFTYGTAYKIVQYGKATLTAVKGIGKIVTGVGSVLGSGGLTLPVAVLAVISGANDVRNAMMDATYTYTGEYDKIGQNWLKDKLADGGKTVGTILGNEKAGELLGNATYYGIDIVTSLASLDLAMDKIKQLSSTNVGGMAAEMKDILQMKVDIPKILTTDIRELQYQAKLASYTFKETTNFVSNIGAVLAVGGDALDIGKGINSIYTSQNKDFVNPLLDTADKIVAASGLGKGLIGIASWDFGETGAAAKRVGSMLQFMGRKPFMMSGIFFDRDLSNFVGNLGDLKDAVKSVESGIKEFAK